MSGNDLNPPNGPVIEAVLEIWGQTDKKNVFPVAGNSMLPLLQEGDHVVIDHGCDGLQPGDLLSFRQGSKLVVHRLVRIHSSETGLTYLAKGDNVLHYDPIVSPDQVVGRVRAVIRGGRQRSIDTRAWRVVSWLIAAGTLAWMKPLGWGMTPKHKLLGLRPNRLSSALSRITLIIFSLPLRLARWFLWRGGDKPRDLNSG